MRLQAAYEQQMIRLNNGVEPVFGVPTNSPCVTNDHCNLQKCLYSISPQGMKKRVSTLTASLTYTEIKRCYTFQMSTIIDI